MAMHIGGLSSGYDYDSMVEELVAARRVPIDNKQTELEELDYDLGAWAEVQSEASELMDTLDTLRGYELWRNATVDSSNTYVAEATAATAATEQTYSLTVTKIATAQSLSSDELDTSTDLISAGYVSEGDVFEIEGQQITIASGETLSSLRTKINDAASDMSDDARVQAAIIDNRLVLTRENTGAADIVLSDVTGTALQGLGVLDDSGSYVHENTKGTDAEFSVNGISVTRSSNKEITDVIEGITLTLKDTGTTTLEVHPDREAVKTAILDFVEKYNAFAEQVDDYGSIALGSSSDLVQKGELYGDNLISSIETNIRRYATAVESPVLNTTNAAYTYEGAAGVMDALNDIGIWTSGQANQLELLDESRLDQVLKNDFDLVEQMFKGTYDSTEIAYTNGVASDFYKYMSQISESMTGDIAKRIDALTEQYDDLSDEITELESSLGDYEQDQWDNFTRMEDALAEMNSQLDYINSMFNNNSDD